MRDEASDQRWNSSLRMTSDPSPTHVSLLSIGGQRALNAREDDCNVFSRRARRLLPPNSRLCPTLREEDIRGQDSNYFLSLLTSLHFINAEQCAAPLSAWTGLCSRLKSNAEACEMENQVFVKQVIQINLLLCEQPAVYTNNKLSRRLWGSRSLHSRLQEGKTPFAPPNPTMPHFPPPPSLFTSSLLWIWTRHSRCHAGWKNILHDSSSFSMLTGFSAGEDLLKRSERVRKKPTFCGSGRAEGSRSSLVDLQIPSCSDLTVTRTLQEHLG